MREPIRWIWKRRVPGTALVLAASLLFGIVAPPLAQASLWGDRRQAMERSQERQRSLERPWETLPAVQAQEKKDGLDLPRDLGGETESYRPEKGAQPFEVIHIQDAHGYVSAQKNLAKILEFLRGRGPEGAQDRPLLVCVEGAWKKVPLEWLHLFPDEALRRRLADGLVASAEITGEEYLGILQGEKALDVRGVEDEKTYGENVRAKESVQKAQAEILDGKGAEDRAPRRVSLRAIEGALERLKLAAFDSKLKDFDRRRSEFNRGTLSAGAYALYLKKAAPGLWESQAGPEMKDFLEAAACEAGLEMGRVAGERERLAKLLENELDPRSLVRLGEYGLKYRAGRLSAGEYYGLLVTLGRLNHLDLPAMSRYVEYLAKAESLNLDRVKDGLDDLEARTAEALAAGRPAARRVMAADFWAGLQEKLWTLEMSPREWKAYRDPRNRVSWAQARELLKEGRAELGEDRDWRNFESLVRAHSSAVENYYAVAQRRNRILVENALKAAREKKAARLVLVAGGFHSEGITRLLRERKIPYRVLRPSLGDMSVARRDDGFVKAVGEGSTLRFASRLMSALGTLQILQGEQAVALAALGPEKFLPLYRRYLKDLEARRAEVGSADPTAAALLDEVADQMEHRLFAAPPLRLGRETYVLFGLEMDGRLANTLVIVPESGPLRFVTGEEGIKSALLKTGDRAFTADPGWSLTVSHSRSDRRTLLAEMLRAGQAADGSVRFSEEPFNATPAVAGLSSHPSDIPAPAAPSVPAASSQANASDPLWSWFQEAFCLPILGWVAGLRGEELARPSSFQDGYIRKGERSEAQFMGRLDRIRRSAIRLDDPDWGAPIRQAIDLVGSRWTDVQGRAPQLSEGEFRGYLDNLGQDKIHPFEAVVRGPEDYFLDWSHGDELFLSRDLMAALRNRGPPGDPANGLIVEYVAHAILCRFLGHDPAIALQRELFRDHFASPEDKGLLQRALRPFINDSYDTFNIAIILKRAVEAFIYKQGHDAVGVRGRFLNGLLTPVTREAYRRTWQGVFQGINLSEWDGKEWTWAGEGSRAMAFREGVPFIIKYAKTAEDDPQKWGPLANPPGYDWSHDYGAEFRKPGISGNFLHPSIMDQLRSFEMYGEFAAPLKVFIAEEAYQNLAQEALEELQRYIDIGLVEIMPAPLKIKPVDFPEKDQRPETITISVLLVQAKTEPLKDHLIRGIRDYLATHDAPPPPGELLDPYLDFLRSMWRKGVFQVDCAIENVGLQGDGKIVAYDVIDAGTNFARHLPQSATLRWEDILGHVRDDNRNDMKNRQNSDWRNALKAAFHNDARKRALVDQTIDALIAYQQARFEEFYVGSGEQRFDSLWSPVWDTELGAAQRQSLRQNGLFQEMARIVQGQGSGATILPKSSDDIRAGMARYQGQPLLIAVHAPRAPPSGPDDKKKAGARIQITDPGAGIDEDKTYRLHDLLTGEDFVRSGKDLKKGAVVLLAPYRVHFFVIRSEEDIAGQVVGGLNAGALKFTEYIVPHFPAQATLRLGPGLAPDLIDQLRTGAVQVRLRLSQGKLSKTVPMLLDPRGDGVLIADFAGPPRGGSLHYEIEVQVGKRQARSKTGDIRIEDKDDEDWVLGPRLKKIWQQDGRAAAIYLGNAAGTTDPELLWEGAEDPGLRRTAQAVLNVADADRDQSFRQGIANYRFIFLDDFSHNEIKPEKIWLAAEWVHRQIQAGRAVFIHCHAGIGRSSSIVVAYLALFVFPEKSFDEIVRMVKRGKGDAYPHIRLPRSLSLAQERHLDELREATRRPHYQPRPPGSEIKAVELIGHQQGGTYPVAPGEEIRVRLRVDYAEDWAGTPPYAGLQTNLPEAREFLDQDGFIPARPSAEDPHIFEAVIPRAPESGEFWVKAFAVSHPTEHDRARVPIGGLQVNFKVHATGKLIAGSLFDPLIRKFIAGGSLLYKAYTALAAPLWEEALFRLLFLGALQPIIAQGTPAPAFAALAWVFGASIGLFSFAHILVRWMARAQGKDRRVIESRDFYDLLKYLIPSTLFTTAFLAAAHFFPGSPLLIPYMASATAHALYNSAVLSGRLPAGLSRWLPLASLAEGRNTDLGVTVILPIPDAGTAAFDRRSAIFNWNKVKNHLTALIQRIRPGVGTFYLFGLLRPSVTSKFVHAIDFTRLQSGSKGEIERLIATKHLDIPEDVEIVDARRVDTYRLFLTLKRNGRTMSMIIGYPTKQSEYASETWGNPFSPDWLAGPPLILEDAQLRELVGSLGGTRAMADFVPWCSPDALLAKLSDADIATALERRYFRYEELPYTDSTQKDLERLIAGNGSGVIYHLNGRRIFVYLRSDIQDQLEPNLAGDGYAFWKDRYLAYLRKMVASGFAGFRTDLVSEFMKLNDQAGERLLQDVFSTLIRDHRARRIRFLVEVYDQAQRDRIAAMSRSIRSSLGLDYEPVQSYYNDFKNNLFHNGFGWAPDRISAFLNTVDWLVHRDGHARDAFYLTNYDEESLMDLIPDQRVREYFLALSIYIAKFRGSGLFYLRDLLQLRGDLIPVPGGHREGGQFDTHRYLEASLVPSRLSGDALSGLVRSPRVLAALEDRWPIRDIEIKRDQNLNRSQIIVHFADGRALAFPIGFMLENGAYRNGDNVPNVVESDQDQHAGALATLAGKFNPAGFTPRQVVVRVVREEFIYSSLLLLSSWALAVLGFPDGAQSWIVKALLLATIYAAVNLGFGFRHRALYAWESGRAVPLPGEATLQDQLKLAKQGAGFRIFYFLALLSPPASLFAALLLSSAIALHLAKDFLFTGPSLSHIQEEPEPAPAAPLAMIGGSPSSTGFSGHELSRLHDLYAGRESDFRHVLAVADRLRGWGAGENAVRAALLSRVKDPRMALVSLGITGAAAAQPAEGAGRIQRITRLYGDFPWHTRSRAALQNRLDSILTQAGDPDLFLAVCADFLQTLEDAPAWETRSLHRPLQMNARFIFSSDAYRVGRPDVSDEILNASLRMLIGERSFRAARGVAVAAAGARTAAEMNASLQKQADEIRKWLIEELGIPEDRIVKVSVRAKDVSSTLFKILKKGIQVPGGERYVNDLFNVMVVFKDHAPGEGEDPVERVIRAAARGIPAYPGSAWRIERQNLGEFSQVNLDNRTGVELKLIHQGDYQAWRMGTRAHWLYKLLSFLMVAKIFHIHQEVANAPIDESPDFREQFGRILQQLGEMPEALLIPERANGRNPETYLKNGSVHLEAPLPQAPGGRFLQAALVLGNRLIGYRQFQEGDPGYLLAQLSFRWNHGGQRPRAGEINGIVDKLSASDSPAPASDAPLVRLARLLNERGITVLRMLHADRKLREYGLGEALARFKDALELYDPKKDTDLILDLECPDSIDLDRLLQTLSDRIGRARILSDPAQDRRRISLRIELDEAPEASADAEDLTEVPQVAAAPAPSALEPLLQWTRLIGRTQAPPLPAWIVRARENTHGGAWIGMGVAAAAVLLVVALAAPHLGDFAALSYGPLAHQIAGLSGMVQAPFIHSFNALLSANAGGGLVQFHAAAPLAAALGGFTIPAVLNFAGVGQPSLHRADDGTLELSGNLGALASGLQRPGLGWRWMALTQQAAVSRTLWRHRLAQSPLRYLMSGLLIQALWAQVLRVFAGRNPGQRSLAGLLDALGETKAVPRDVLILDLRQAPCNLDGTGKFHPWFERILSLKLDQHLEGGSREPVYIVVDGRSQGRGDAEIRALQELKGLDPERFRIVDAAVEKSVEGIRKAVGAEKSVEVLTADPAWRDLSGVLVFLIEKVGGEIRVWENAGRLATLSLKEFELISTQS